ncbi:YHYH protein [Colwellia sp. MB02u-10]|uniref:YHYH protein n=1 Tax=Colwellia sp. MB02u-10 TaxID=2759828 RepID=UPI0015F36BC8|nr:YHYH protein [Colwellia sp. MB02u-10]MBA6342442.1 YHYH protein [Colwellia sp. MB02u-10]
MKTKISCWKSSSSLLSLCLVISTLTACGGSSSADSDESSESGTTNSAPIANAGTDQSVFLNSTVVLSGELSSDADKDTLGYSWSFSSIPNGSVATLSSDTQVAPTFVADVIGSYRVNLTVDDTLLNSEVDSVEIVVSEVPQSSTLGVLCDYNYNEYNDSIYVQDDSFSQWSCTDSERLLSANGIPDHEVGEFPNEGNPNTISSQTISANLSLSPVESTAATELGGPRGVTGYVLNGVKIDAGTAGSCDDSGDNCSLIDNSGNWSIEALGHTSFNFGTDNNNAHVQPGGTYHYHGMPEGFITKQGGGDTSMTLIGWAADGFPIYARYGYSIVSDATSALKLLTGSFQLKSDVSASRPSQDIYTLGTFAQDWEYVAGSGDLDECNGRVGVTPEFPEGIYHYFATDSYPYFQRCVKGEVEVTGGMPPP